MTSPHPGALTPPGPPGPVARLLHLWFGFRDPVGRRTYVASGVGLMAFKYAVDALLVYLTIHKVWLPLPYLNPIFSMRTSGVQSAPHWVFPTLAVFALPFMWVGVTMSVRRAVDAGLSAWVGLLFIVPLLNFPVILLLGVAPPKATRPWNPRAATVYRDGAPPPSAVHVGSGVKSALQGVAGSVALGLGMMGISVYGIGAYGAALFLITPFFMGALTAFLYNRQHQREMGKTMMVAVASCVITGSAMMLFALEGLICLAMAFPIACTASVFGAMVGRAIAGHTRTPLHQAAALFLVLPGAAGVEAKLQAAPLHEVISVVEIDAPPERVWSNVIGFSDLPAPAEWIFHTGLAFPLRARIDGAGVGAVRHCEFSTGAFVEPITTWEPGRRLGFSVASQPPAMKEWSPFRMIHPPHLDGSIRSKRGEFRLIALPDGRTRLEGSTWYELSMYPEAYWQVWSDATIHAIHGRVLAHVKRLSEVGGQ